MLKEVDFINGNFQKIIDLVNANIFWKDINGCYLGCNQYVLDWFGIKNQEELIGRCSYDVLTIPKNEIAQFLENDQYALKNGIFEGEEYATINGIRRTYSARKIAFYDDHGKVVGLLGTALDITDQKTLLEFQRKKSEEQLQALQIIDSVNASIYWKDQHDQKYLGCNRFMFKMLGITSREEIVGKTDFDFLSKEDAQKINMIDRSVLTNGHFEGEESVTLPSGDAKTFFTIKNQLTDSEGNIVGIVGNSIDITAQKEVEGLVEKEHQQFRTIVNQVVHDIISPLSALRMIIPRLTDVPEKQRITLKQATAQIEDIANDLLRQYRAPEEQVAVSTEPEVLFTFMELTSIISEKRLEFSALPVTFNKKIDADAYFVFIQANRTDWLRMLSNLINNAVDALDGKAGTVQLELRLEAEKVVVTVVDTGKGMSSIVRDKILQGTAVTDGKKDGHGIGMTQVVETLQKHKGRLAIESTPNQGTKMIVTFPRVATPAWAATELNLTADQTVLILDDDQFIHGAWETKFAPVLATNPNMKLIHFTQGDKLLEYLATLDQTEMSKIYLLSDYELLNQKKNGLDIIEQTQIQQAMLVTSHYANAGVVARAKKLNIFVLPKRLTSKIPIRLVETVESVA
jgi:PAS domain S-box-containing protein